MLAIDMSSEVPVKCECSSAILVGTVIGSIMLSAVATVDDIRNETILGRPGVYLY
jgi:hypothetical protein